MQTFQKIDPLVMKSVYLWEATIESNFYYERTFKTWKKENAWNI